jgi:hypothetical protein
MKYFILGIIFSFVLYWATTGALRRLFLPPRKKNPSSVDRRHDDRDDRDNSRDQRRPPPRRVDYDNIKDADYRDLE